MHDTAMEVLALIAFLCFILIMVLWGIIMNSGFQAAFIF